MRTQTTFLLQIYFELTFVNVNEILGVVVELLSADKFPPFFLSALWHLRLWLGLHLARPWTMYVLSAKNNRALETKHKHLYSRLAVLQLLLVLTSTKTPPATYATLQHGPAHQSWPHFTNMVKKGGAYQNNWPRPRPLSIVPTARTTLQASLYIPTYILSFKVELLF